MITPEVRKALQELSEASFVAHRDALAVLPLIEAHGEAVALTWVRACRVLFLHDRDAGRAFLHGSAAAEEASEEVLPWTRQALGFLEWSGSWKAAEGFMENLPRAYAVLGHAGEARWAEIGLAWCARHPDSGIAYFRAPVDELAGGQGITGIEHIARTAEDLFEQRRLPLSTFLSGAIRVRKLLGADVVLPWALRGADIMQIGRLRGEAYFRLESEESLHLLMERLPGYHLPEHQRLLQFLMAAWFGEGPSTGLRTGIGLKEGVWSGEQGRAFVETDGRDLYLPAAMSDREEAVLGVLHTAGHLVFGSYRRDHIEALFREAGADPPEADQAISWQPLFARFSDDALRFTLLFDLCEDLRVDCRIRRVIPNHLARMLELAESRPPPPEPARAYYELALQTLRWAEGFFLQASSGQAPAPAFSGEGAPEDGVAQWLPLLAGDASVLDAFRVAVRLYRHGALPSISTLDEMHEAYLPGRSPNMARAVYLRERPQETGRQGRGDEEEDRPAGDSENPPEPQTPDEAGGDPGGDAAAEDDARAGVGVGGRQSVRVRSPGQPLHERGFPYPEWDYREGRYKRNWAWVQERRLTESNPGEAMRLAHLHAGALTRLKKAIQAQKPTRQAPLKRQPDGDDIDLDAAVAFVAEKAAGLSPLANLYRRRQVRQRDTAVILLADLSTSVMQQLPEGQGRVVERIRAGLLLFAESLEGVGDAYSIAGFSSKYRDSVSYYPIKDFDEPYTEQTRALIGGLSGRLATRMGAAVRHALTRFRAAPARRRLLLILSDGRPEDYDDGGDLRYLHEDTRMAVKEAGDQGVHAFCITVDAAGAEYLPRIFGAGHYLVLDHVNSLPRKLPEIYLRLRK